MNLLALRERNAEDVLKKKYIQKVLNEQGSSILAKQNEAMRSRGFTNANFYDNKLSAGKDRVTLEIKHLHRFVDIKTRQTKSGKKPKKNHPIYNKIVFGHLPNIINELSFGFTDTVIAEMKQLEGDI